jgi:hypothetical protein
VLVLRLILHARHENAELSLDVLECHLPFPRSVIRRTYLPVVTGYSTGKSKKVEG